MAGERGNFTMTKSDKPLKDKDLGQEGINKVLKKWAKRREKANRLLFAMTSDQKKLAKLDALVKADSSIGPIVNTDGNLSDLEQARYHVGQFEKHRKLARECRSGVGVISKGHGEAMARMHDATAEWHAEQARQTKVV